MRGSGYGSQALQCEKCKEKKGHIQPGSDMERGRAYDDRSTLSIKIFCSRIGWLVCLIRFSFTAQNQPFDGEISNIRIHGSIV
jgi:hypothetical protein